MKQDEFKKRSDNIELLEKYSNWLMKNGYLDTDWQSEPPYAIDEFLKTLPKNLLSKKPSVSDEEINNIIRTRIQELKRDNDNNYLEYDMVEKDMPEQLEAIRKMIKDALSLPPQVVQSEVSDDVNIVLDNKHEINYNITPPDAENWISVDERLPENEDDVLVFVDYGGVQTKIEQAYYFEKDWYWLNDSYIVYKVTHWMPLPKPPINKQGGK